MTGVRKDFGVCPFCGSDDAEIDYDEFDGEYAVYKCSCNVCNKNWTDVFKAVYDGYNADDENGKEHLFDKDGNEL